MRKSTNGSSLKRRSLMLPDSFDVDMAELRQKTGAQSDSEVIRRAFKLLKKLASEENEVILKDKKTGEIKHLEVLL